MRAEGTALAERVGVAVVHHVERAVHPDPHLSLRRLVQASERLPDGLGTRLEAGQLSGERILAGASPAATEPAVEQERDGGSERGAEQELSAFEQVCHCVCHVSRVWSRRAGGETRPESPEVFNFFLALVTAVGMLTAVVLANGNDGDNLYPLTEDMPLAALPVGNRPLLSYQLEMLQRAGSFGEVLVVTNDRHLSRLEAVVSEYRGPLRIELVVVEEGAGSADALRTLRGRGRLAGDFALISGDTISDVPFQKIAAMHQLHGASVTVLLKQQPPRPAADKKKARDLDGTDFVGIDESRQRLLYLESAADCDGGVITVSESMLRAHPHLEAHSALAEHRTCREPLPEPSLNLL